MIDLAVITTTVARDRVAQQFAPRASLSRSGAAACAAPRFAPWRRRVAHA